MAKLALIFDYKFCQGCHVCDVACRKAHPEFAEEDFGVTIYEQGPMQFSTGEWMWNYLPVPTSLCDGCKERREAGTDPTCVHHCLAKCIEIVPLEEVSARFAELGDTVAAFTIKAED